MTETLDEFMERWNAQQAAFEEKLLSRPPGIVGRWRSDPDRWMLVAMGAALLGFLALLVVALLVGVSIWAVILPFVICGGGSWLFVTLILRVSR